MEVLLLALPFLACPLMMLFCLVGMRKMGCATSRAGDAPTSLAARPDQVAALQRQLQTIQAELAALQPSETPVPHPAHIRRPGTSEAAMASPSSAGVA
jgi:hypothetical protein